MIDRKAFWSMKELSRLFSSIENIEINRRFNAIVFHILLNQSSKSFRSCSCCTSCIVINSYVIFICYLMKLWSELRAFQRRKNDRSSFIIAIVLRLENSCRCQISNRQLKYLQRCLQKCFAQFFIICTIASHLAF